MIRDESHKKIEVNLVKFDTPYTDTISRQAAIDAMREETCLSCWDAKDILKHLPTVTPQPEIVRCGQCKYAEVADSEDIKDGYTCQFHRGSIWFSGSYCSWAERRQDG